VVPGVPGLSQYYWASSPNYSLGIFEVVANRVRRLLRVVLVSVFKDGRLILGKVAECQPRVLLLLSLHLVQCEVLSLLGYYLLPLLATHLLSHLDPPRLGVVDLGGHEDLRLGLLSSLDLA